MLHKFGEDGKRMKKISLLLLTYLILWGPHLSQATSVNTYHPSPFGVFDRMKLVPRDPTAAICDPGTEAGTVFFDNIRNTLVYCADTTSYKPLSQIWTNDLINDYVFPVDLDVQAGIGTQTPTNVLHVEEVLGINVPLVYIEDSAATSGNKNIFTLNAMNNAAASLQIHKNGALKWAITLDDGLGAIDENALVFSSSLGPQMIIKENGNFGVGSGTTDPTANFSIRGPDRTPFPTPTGPLWLQTMAIWMSLDGNNIDSSFPLHLNSITNQNISIAAGGGNVGIGVPNPQFKLHVESNLGNWPVSFMFQRPVFTDNETMVAVDIDGPQNSGFSMYQNGNQRWSIYNKGSTSGPIPLDSLCVDSNDNCRMVLTQAGNLGI